MNVVELWAIKIFCGSKNVDFSVFIKFIHKACAVEKILVKPHREKITEFDEADDRTSKTKRQDSAIVTHNVIPGI